jgi:hypothetical protein
MMNDIIMNIDGKNDGNLKKKGISIANLRYPQEHADPVQGHCDICEQRHCNGCVQVTRRCGLCTLNTAML